MSQQDSPDLAIRLTITPEPTDEEAAAIAAVVTALAGSGNAEEAQPEARRERWAQAGRQEALRGPLWPVDDGATMRD